MNHKKISIVGILAAVALSSFGGYTNNTPTSGTHVYDGGGATVTFNSWNDSFVFATGCDTITLKNYTFKYNPLPISGGLISYHVGNTVKFTPLTGMNTTQADLAKMDSGSFHKRYGTLVGDTLQNYAVSNVSIAGGVVTCTVASSPTSSMVGNYMFIFARTAASIGEFRRCNKVVLENITFQGTPSSAFKGTDLGEVKATNVATDPAANFMNDGRGVFNFGNINKATFTGCNLTGIGDDGINLHSIGRVVSGRTGNTISIYPQILSTRWVPNQVCIIVNPSDNTWVYTGTIQSVNATAKTITFTTTPPDSAIGCIVYNDRMCGYGGLTITNNTIVAGRRNALIMTPVCSSANRGNISGNTFEHLGMRAFYTHHDDIGWEGYRSQYVNIHDNYFNDLALADFPNNSFVTVSLLKEMGWKGIGGVNVQSNEFLNLGTRTGIRITDAQSCDLSGNTNPNITVPIVKVNTTNVTP